MGKGRLPPGPWQVIDRTRETSFRYNGRRVTAYHGDTVASALYAAGVRIFNRSFKYHRPRGLTCVSGRCPNCMVNIDGTPSERACTVEAEGVEEVRGQNAWPSLEHDALSLLDRMDRLLPVGFYYKIFHKPKLLWRLAEPVIRRIAGLGTVDVTSTPNDRYEHRNMYVEVVVVGGGPAGCKAAVEAAKQGVRVALIEDQPWLGGHQRWQRSPVSDGGEYAGIPGHQVAALLAEEVGEHDNITVFTGATAYGLYEGNLLGVHQGQEVIKLRAQQVVVASGAQEVPSVFPNNDLPGIMLSSAVVRLANLYGVSPGERGVVATDNDQGLAAALELTEAGVDVTTVADSRPNVDSKLVQALRSRGITLLSPYRVRRAEGKKSIRAVVLERLEEGRPVPEPEWVRCDFLGLAAGYDPATALLAQGGCRLEYDEGLGETVARETVPGVHAAGEVTGIHHLETSLLQGRLAGLRAGLAAKGVKEDESAELQIEVRQAEEAYRSGLRLGRAAVTEGPGKQFVCLCQDVTDKDIRYAIEEGFDDVQTLKRYSAVSMGPCQGKMCLKSYLGICAEAMGRSMEEVGRTTPRPPVQPVPMGAIGGPGHMPFRLTSIHHRHVEMGGKMVEVGEWKRAHSYGSPPDPQAEVRAVRERVGIMDVSTLGKLEVRGRDAATLMDRLYTHHFSSLRVGRIRYGIICSDVGVILDDGTVTRLAEDRYYVTTGSGNIDLVEQWFRLWSAGTGMCVHITNVTPAYAAVNVAGPRARETLSKLTDVDLSPKGFRYMRSASGEVAGVPAILMRIGFVGETGWEIHLPSEYGEHLWDSLLEAGREFDISPFGVEAQRVLRLEKKHLIPGQDTDVVSNPLEADMEWAVRFDKEDFLGRSALKSVQDRGLRNKLVGFVMDNGALPLDGVPVLHDGRPVGKVTSSRFSPTQKKGFGLAWVPIELSEDGTRIDIRVDGSTAPASVRSDPLYDPEGKRLRE